MRASAWLLAALLAAAVPAKALETVEVAVPDAFDTLFPLPEVEGAVPWQTLGMVEMVFEGVDLVPSYADEVLALDGQQVKMVGFLMPLDATGTRLLLSMVSPACPFCLPGGPTTLVELVAADSIPWTDEAVVVTGRFDVIDDPWMGYYYRMTEVTLAR